MKCAMGTAMYTKGGTRDGGTYTLRPGHACQIVEKSRFFFREIGTVRSGARLEGKRGAWTWEIILVSGRARM